LAIEAANVDFNIGNLGHQEHLRMVESVMAAFIIGIISFTRLKKHLS